MMKRLLLLLTMLISGAHYAGAQTSRPFTDREAGKSPLWVAMMDDTAANFFQTERAFNLYFKKHELPEGEHEEIGERREREKTPSRRKQRRIAKENDLRMQVKRYHFWRDQTLPYVQPDGHILTPAERLAIWHKQQR